MDGYLYILRARFVFFHHTILDLDSYIYIYAGADTGLSSGGGDKIQEEEENQVTYQSIGIWMFCIRTFTKMFDTTNNFLSSMTFRQSRKDL